MTRDQLREHLDRKPPRCLRDDMHPWSECADRRSWRDWFEMFDVEPLDRLAVTYLGEVSARTGPDAVPAVQPCGCGQCRAPKEP